LNTHTGKKINEEGASVDVAPAWMEEEDSIPAHLRPAKETVDKLQAVAAEELDDEQCFALLEF